MRTLHWNLLFAALMLFWACESHTQDRQNTQSSLLDAPKASPSEKLSGKDIIALESLLSNEYYIANTQELYLLVNLQAGKAAKQAERPGLNLSLVLDRSGSMEGEKLKYAKEACKFLIDNLEKDDIISLVIYDDDVEVLSASSKVQDKQALKDKIDRIREDGSTNLSGGMLEGYNQVKSTYDPKRVNRVLLLSDGLANQGITDQAELQKIAQQKNREEGITLSTFGIGADFNEILMTNLAEYGSGNYYFIESAEKIPEIFAKELKGLLSVVAQNSKIEIEFPSDYLSVAKVYGFPHKAENGKIEIDFKDVFSEELKSVLIKFTFDKAPSSTLKFRTNLQYDDAQSYERVNLKSENKLKITKELSTYQKSFDQTVMQLVALYRANEELEKAMAEVDGQEYDKAKSTLQTAQDNLKRQMKTLPKSKELDKQLRELKTYQEEVENFENYSREEQKMIQKGKRNANYELRKRR